MRPSSWHPAHTGTVTARATGPFIDHPDDTVTAMGTGQDLTSGLEPGCTSWGIPHQGRSPAQTIAWMDTDTWQHG